MMLKQSIAVLVLAVCLVGLKADRPLYIGCVDSIECGPDSCCVLGNNRYSVPACQPLLSSGDSCRARGHDPANLTVYYPNGDSVALTNIYHTFCKCGAELACSELVAALVMALWVSHGATGRCPGSRATSLNLSVASRRNLTGHWIVSVDVTRADPRRALTLRSPRQVALDLEHGTASCEDSELVQMTFTVTVPPAPPADYEVINGLGHYKMHTTALSWEDARDKCVQEGAHLIIINSDEEAEVVRTYFARKPKIVNLTDNAYAALYSHVGFHDRFVEGQFVTVQGCPWTAPATPAGTPVSPRSTSTRTAVSLTRQRNTTTGRAVGSCSISASFRPCDVVLQTYQLE